MKIVILQLKDVEKCNYAFRDFDKAQKYGFSFADDYEVKFCGGFDLENKADDEILEIIFRNFNRVDEADVERLKSWGFEGHSLSISDIVSIDGREYYCESFGWHLLTEEDKIPPAETEETEIEMITDLDTPAEEEVVDDI